MKKLAGATAALVILFLLAAPATAGPYLKKPTCSVSDTTVSPGDEVTVSGRRWNPGSQVDIILRPGQILLGTATVGPDKRFSIVVTIPEDLRPGRYKIFCRGEDKRGNPRVIGTNIEVLGEVVTAPGGAGVAGTGAPSSLPLWAALAVILALAGVTALIVSRRLQRRRPDTS